MRAIKVQYTVKSNFVEENKRNIRKVMAILTANPIKGMQYSSFTSEENPNTFIHFNMAIDDDTMGKINGLQEFKDFQQALKKSQPIAPPKATKLQLVGSGFIL